MIEPRYYQSEAVEAIIKAWRGDVSRALEASKEWQPGDKIIPYIMAATASGKSMMISMIVDRVAQKKRKALVFGTKLEEVENIINALFDIGIEKHEIGICCSQLGKAEVNKNIVVAMPGSFYRYRSLYRFDVIIADECHFIGNDERSIPRKIFSAQMRLNPAVYIGALSATPYREGQGMMHESCIKGKALFTHLVYEVPIAKMIEEGYLCHIESINGDCEIDTSDLRTKGNDFDLDQMNVKFDAISESAVYDMKAKFNAYNIQTAIIFTSSIANAYHIAELWGNDEIKVLHGGVGKCEREKITGWLETGQGRRIVINPNILTQGYDFPALQAVVLMRATKSLRLYVQMVGRVIRAHSEKALGYVLDYGQNIDRHGSIDATNPPKNRKKKGEAPMRLCTECGTLNRLTAKKCEQCEAVFIIDETTGLYSMKTKAQILSDKLKAKEKEYIIEYDPVFIKAWSKKDNTEMIKMLLAGVPYEHYICLAHKGYARNMAEQFILNLLKNQDDFFLLKQNGKLTVDNMINLLNNYYSNFFKKIEAVTIGARDGRKQLVNMVLTETDNVSA